MKIKSVIFIFLITMLMAELSGCKSNLVLAPTGSVPKRADLQHDAFGGYITVNTMDNITYSGELIGLRNDSIIVLSGEVIKINLKDISGAKIVVHSPNHYGGWILLALPNLLLLGVTGEEGEELGGGPLVLALVLTAIDGGGIAAAQGTEEKKLNYYDWTEGMNEVMKYSRFPSGVPQNISLSKLEGRVVPLNQNTK